MRKYCAICGKPSGMYPLCTYHNRLKEDGEVVKCEYCGAWHMADERCKCGKYSDLPLKGFSKCVICGEPTKGYAFCRDCYNDYSDDELIEILNGERKPRTKIIYKDNEQKHGKALSKDEEEKLLTMSFGTPYHLMFAVALYTGLRPNEYSSAHIEGDFIIAINSKQKDGKVHYKKIPITPMLRPYLNGISELKFYGANRIAERLKSILPNHKLYDLRTTFYTRCQECGIADIAIKKFVGHSLGGLADTYTDLSDKFLLDEGAKFKY